MLPTSCCPCPEDRGAFLQNKRLPCQGPGAAHPAAKAAVRTPRAASHPPPLPHTVPGHVPSPQTKRRASRTPGSQTSPQHPPPAALRGLGPPGGSLPTQGLHQQVGLSAEPNVSERGDQAPAGSPRRPSPHSLPLPPAPPCRSSERGWSRQALLQALAKGAGAAACGHQRARTVPLEEHRETKETLTEGSGN